MILSILLIFVSCLFSSLFSILLKIGVNKKNLWYVFFSLVLSFVALIIYLFALSSLPMSIARIFTSLNFVLVPLFSYYFLNEKLTKELIIGIVLIILGEIVMFL